MYDINHVPVQAREGLEFINFQKDTFYKELVNELDRQLKENSKLTEVDALLKIMETYTGFKNITLVLHEDVMMSLAVDTGYFLPNHVLNNRMVDELINPKDSTVFKMLKKKNTDFLKGEVDLTTGKVSGCFSDLEITIYCPTTYGHAFSEKVRPKNNMSDAEVLAVFLIHELGHPFSMCYLSVEEYKKNFTSYCALNLMTNEKRGKEQITILLEACEVLDIKPSKDKIKLLESNNDVESKIAYLETEYVAKVRSKSLSVGVSEMTSEVMADIYAMRMGAGQNAVHAISLFKRVGEQKDLTLLGLTICAELTSLVSVVPGVYTMLTILSGFMRFSRNISGDYDTDERRMDEMLRQSILQIREDKSLSAKDKLTIISNIDELRKKSLATRLASADALNPVQHTVRRFMYNLLTRGDFSKREFEHYTRTLAVHELSLLEHKFANMIA